MVCGLNELNEDDTVRWLLEAPTDVQMNNRALALFVRFRFPEWERIMKRAAFEIYTRGMLRE